MYSPKFNREALRSRDEECIVAQCTPQGTGALALIRISGHSVRSLIEGMIRFVGSKSLTTVSTHTIHYATIVDSSGQPLDKVMVLVMDAPRTFTGQDTIEITCHNNPFLIEALIQETLNRGARLAQEGEFTRRAYESGKIDLIQAESINELITAQTQHALKRSLSQLEGSFSHWITHLEKELLQAISWCEASFEFLDEEVEFGPQLSLLLKNILCKITTIKQTFNAQQQIRQGIKIVLIGSVNVGKSSLFNTLLNQKRAIVHEAAGTTRDSIEAGIIRQGNTLTLIDTAGLRETDNQIEQEGIKRSHEEAQKADVILLVYDGTREMSPQELESYRQLMQLYANKCILIRSKSDKGMVRAHPLFSPDELAVSSHSGENIQSLNESIDRKIQALFQKLDSPFLLNKRHYSLLIDCEKKLEQCVSMLTQKPQYELISYCLNDALTTLSELTGRSISEAALDKVFREFCVGK